MNWKNTTENLGITIAVMLVTAFITYKSTLNSALKSNAATNAAIMPAIIEGIKKETIKNEIKNEIALDIDKIKKSDTLQININQQPLNDQKPTNTITKTEDCAVSVSQYNSLSDGEKKRLKRWLN